jgi:hypothetical protein
MKKKKNTTIKNPVYRRKKPADRAETTGFEITVTYNGHWADFDRLIRNFARQLGGKEVGSGYDLKLRRRDLEFRFPSRAARSTFMECVRSPASLFVAVIS